MNLFHSTIDNTDQVEQSGVPRKVLRTLLIGNGLGPASRVLVVGGASEELLRCLDGLGLLATGFESESAQLTALRRSHPLTDWRGGAPDETSFLPDHAFDLIVVRQHPEYHNPLNRAAAFRTTTDLLAALRPGRTLAFLHLPANPDDEASHPLTSEETARHLAFFPGACHLEFFADFASRAGLRRSQDWDAAPWLVQLQIPREAISRDGWTRYGEIAANASARDDWSGSSQSTRRNAA